MLVIFPSVVLDSEDVSPFRPSAFRSPAAILSFVSDVAVSVNENFLSVLSAPEIFFVTYGVSSSLATVLKLFSNGIVAVLSSSEAPGANLR